MKEKGTNRGKRVEEYQKEAGIPAGSPWCAAFVNWCAKQAANFLEEESPLEALVLEGYVPEYYKYAKDHNWLISVEEAGPGDLVCFNFGGKRWDHIAIVDWVDEKNKIVHTIEGNTNSAGSREGDSVAAKKRGFNLKMCFIRWC